jgi:hypothetical protein
MNELDPLKLDRDIARGARAERNWRRTLRDDAERAAGEAWYEPIRHVTTRTTFAAVSELSASDPLREGFVLWIHRLAVTRIASRVLVAAARARQAPMIELETPERGQVSARELVRRALADREPLRRRAWLEGIAPSAPSILALEKALREATSEIEAKLGVTDPSRFVPWDGAALEVEAKTFLAASRDLAASSFAPREDVAGLIGDLVARDVPGIWPRAPDARWLFDEFRSTPLLDGLSLDIGPTPRALGASSFARALARFGAAYARAAVAGGRTFVMASDPSELHPYRRGALFAGLLLDPFFLRKKLGMSRDAAESTSRTLAKTALADLRLAATRTLVDFARASPSDLEETSSEALQVRVPLELAGVLPRPSPRAPAHVTAALLAHVDAESMRSQFDEDWFANPHALLYLRDVDASPRPLRIAKETLDGSAAKLVKHLEAMVG